MNFSVLMSVYLMDSPIFLNEAIKSIYSSQLLKPNQIVVVCDGPLLTEHYQVLNFWEKKHPDIFQTHKLLKNTGLANALNYGLKFCKHDYVARMDSDDISHPSRFLFQLEFLKKNPEITILGTSMFEFNDTIDNIISYRKVPTSHFKIKESFKYLCPINHPTVIYKKNDILKIGGYNNIYLKEDLDLWLRLLISGYKFHNLNEKLFFYRISDNFYQRRGGIKYSLSELKLIHFRFNKNLINIFQYIFMCLVVLPIRLLPVFIRKIIYKYILR